MEKEWIYYISGKGETPKKRKKENKKMATTIIKTTADKMTQLVINKIEETGTDIYDREHMVIGWRWDHRKYDAGDETVPSKSHDCRYDDDVEDGEYAYLSGTSVWAVIDHNDEIVTKTKNIDIWMHDYVTIIGGDYAEDGQDDGEIVVSDTEVIAQYTLDEIADMLAEITA
jgi:hypothetical protein